MISKIEARDVNFGNFHTKGSERYIIPTLQRPYSWDKRSVEKLWNDISENEPGYYIGSIVAVTEGGATGKDQIIDGQQRLTTLSLFLIALRDYLKSKNARGLSHIESEIEDILIKYRKDGYQTRLSFSEEKSMLIYQDLVEGNEIQETGSNLQRRFLQNYSLILDKFKELSPKCKISEIESIFDKIKNLQLIFIQCKDKTAAYGLFESLNATGLSLATNDLLKNSIFESLCDDEKRLREVEDGWKSMFQDFNEDSADLKKYIRHHWISTVGYINNTGLFTAFTDKYSGNEFQYAQSLFKLSGIYLSLRNGFVESLKKISARRYDITEIKETLLFLSYLGVDQVYPVLLHLYENDNKDFKKDLYRLAAFQFLYKYVPGSPSVPEKKFFSNFCEGKISKQVMFDGLYKLCSKQENAFSDALIQRIKYVKGRSGDVQFLLEKFTYLSGGTYIKKPTVEHIIPQDESDPVYSLFEDTPENMRLIHTIGNLTILEEDENSDTTKFNQVFHIKAKLYKQHAANANKAIDSYGFDLDPVAAIKKRSRDVASEIYNMFLHTLESGKWKRK